MIDKIETGDTIAVPETIVNRRLRSIRTSTSCDDTLFRTDSLSLLIAFLTASSFVLYNENSGLVYNIRMLLLSSWIGAQRIRVDKSCGSWQFPEGAHHEVYVGFNQPVLP